MPSSQRWLSSKASMRVLRGSTSGTDLAGGAVAAPSTAASTAAASHVAAVPARSSPREDAALAWSTEEPPHEVLLVKKWRDPGATAAAAALGDFCVRLGCRAWALDDGAPECEAAAGAPAGSREAAEHDDEPLPERFPRLGAPARRRRESVADGGGDCKDGGLPLQPQTGLTAPPLEVALELGDMDLVICVGGDGTVLHLSSLFERLPMPPVLAVAFGSLGFLTVHSEASARRLLRRIFAASAPARDLAASVLPSTAATGVAAATTTAAAPASAAFLPATPNVASAKGAAAALPPLPPTHSRTRSPSPTRSPKPLPPHPLLAQHSFAHSQSAATAAVTRQVPVSIRMRLEVDVVRCSSRACGSITPTPPPADAAPAPDAAVSATTSPFSPVSAMTSSSTSVLAAAAGLQSKSVRSGRRSHRSLGHSHVSAHGGSDGHGGGHSHRGRSRETVAPPPLLPLGEPEAQRCVLNELLLERGKSPFMASLTVFVDGEPLTTVNADGLLVATQTGSTAYALSAGGSIVQPNSASIMFVPICPHTLSFRPLVLSDATELRIEVPADARTSAWASFDGRHSTELRRGDCVVVRASPWPLPLLCRRSATADWIRAIREKLMWNMRSVAQKPLRSARVAPPRSRLPPHPPLIGGGHDSASLPASPQLSSGTSPAGGGLGGGGWGAGARARAAGAGAGSRYDYEDDEGGGGPWRDEEEDGEGEGAGEEGDGETSTSGGSYNEAEGEDRDEGGPIGTFRTAELDESRFVLGGGAGDGGGGPGAETAIARTRSASTSASALRRR